MSNTVLSVSMVLAVLDATAIAAISAAISAVLVKVIDKTLLPRTRRNQKKASELLDIAEREAALGRRMQEWMDRIEEDLLDCQDQHRKCQEETRKLREEHAREVASLRLDLSVIRAQVSGLTNGKGSDGDPS